MTGDHNSQLKHRHDVGSPDHGPVTTEQSTEGIQFVIGTCIAGTLALLIYVAVAL